MDKELNIDMDIDKFLNESFSKIEKKFDEKINKKNAVKKNINSTQSNTNVNVSKKMEKIFNKYKNDDNNNMTTIDDVKIPNFNFEKVIDTRILEEMNMENKNKCTINLENLIKPLFPSDKIFENEFKNADKVFILDKFIGYNKKNKNEKTNDNNINQTNFHLKKNKYKKTKESEIISFLKSDSSLKYLSMLEINVLWNNYITSLLNRSLQHDTIYNKIIKADLHGAIIKITDSKNKNQINIEGINLLETRRTFNLLTVKNEVKTILKKGSVFKLDIPYGNLSVKFIGDNIMYKAVERTKAKFKNKYNL